jgi:septal ring factor EnvC (AmiA/AmiB activator)
MTETPNLEFIAAQLAKVLDAQRETKAAVSELQVGLAATRADMGLVKSSVSALQESVKIIEHDISGIRLRLERIERNK